MGRKQNRLAAPHVAFKTFRTALDFLADGTSDPVDATALSNLSGSNRGPALRALRFLGLIDDQGKRQPDLQAVLDPVQQKDKLRELLISHYKFAHDLEGMTPGRLKQEVEMYNVSRDTAEKAKSFFIAAAQYSELPLPNQLLERKQSTRRTRHGPPRPRPRSNAQERQRTVEPNQQQRQLDSRTKELRSGRKITLTIEGSFFDVAADERKFVSNLKDAFDSPVRTPPAKKRRRKRIDSGATQFEFAEPGKQSWRQSDPANDEPAPRRGSSADATRAEDAEMGQPLPDSVEESP